VPAVSCLLYEVVKEQHSVLVQVEAKGQNGYMHTGLFVNIQLRTGVQNLHRNLMETGGHEITLSLGWTVTQPKPVCGEQPGHYE